MLTLGAESLKFENVAETSPFLIRLCENERLAKPLRSTSAYLARSPVATMPEGFRLYVLIGNNPELAAHVSDKRPTLRLSKAFSYLADGDIIRVSPKRRGVRTLYRRGANCNSILLTEQCNNYCLMCSQPPKLADDSWIVNEVLELLPMIDRGTRELVYSGGEPTLLGQNLIRILNATKAWLPDTAIHVLSNGRRFSDESFASDYAAVGHPDLMVGIPVYSDIANIHDYVVQAHGAFDDTIRGILNLKRYGQRVEIRVVVHKQTYERLKELAEFITRNLLFIDHVAIMGLEMTGFTKFNIADLWVDPHDYRSHLYDAVTHLALHGVNVSIYNHQLCVLDQRLWRFSKKSISDWKNEYFAECTDCSKREQCGGFFSSASLRYSDYIRPIKLSEDDTMSLPIRTGAA